MNAAKDFRKETVKALSLKGIRIMSSTWLPGETGSFANGERGYILDDNGTQRTRTYLQVLAL